MSYHPSRANERLKNDKIEPGSLVVFLGGIPTHVHSAEIVQFLTERFGTVDAFKLIMDNVTGKHKGYGFARFVAPEVAESARRLKFIEFHGKTINLGDAYTGGAYQSNGGRRTGNGVAAASAPRTENGPVLHYPSNTGNQWYAMSNPPSSNLPSYPLPAQGATNSRGYTPPPARPQMSTPINQGPIVNGSQGPHRRATEICRFWADGRCRKGVNCAFIHSIAENEWRNNTMHLQNQNGNMGVPNGIPPTNPQAPYGAWDNRNPSGSIPPQQGIPMAAPSPVHPNSGMGYNNYPADTTSVQPAYYPYYNTGPEPNVQSQAWATGYSYAGL